MKTMKDLKAGDELICYMRLGLALSLGRKPDGSVYRYVPTRTQRARPEDLTRFMGTVRTNHTDVGVISMSSVGISAQRRPMAHSPTAQVEVQWGSFSRVLLISPYAFEPREENRSGGLEARPTTAGIGTNFKAYHTLENIVILP